MKRILPALLLVACGDGSVPLDRYAEEFAPVYCARMFDCCSVPRYASYEECTRLETGDVNLTWEVALRQEVEAGHIIYDGRALARCLAESRAAPCHEVYPTGSFGNREDWCRDATIPLVEDGSDCSRDIGCLSGDCRGTVSCAPTGTVGEPCDTAVSTLALCEPGLTCASSGTCQLPLSDGSPCASRYDCASEDCTAGLCAAPTECQGAGP